MLGMKCEADEVKSTDSKTASTIDVEYKREYKRDIQTDRHHTISSSRQTPDHFIALHYLPWTRPAQQDMVQGTSKYTSDSFNQRQQLSAMDAARTTMDEWTHAGLPWWRYKQVTHSLTRLRSSFSLEKCTKRMQADSRFSIRSTISYNVTTLHCITLPYIKNCI